MSASDKQPSLASLVQAGEAQTEAVAVTDFIFMVKDISNLYLVKTADGDLLVNAGFMDSAERNRALLAPHREGPRLSELPVQTSTDGAPMARLWGRGRIAGQVIWASRFSEHQSESGGGKGGPSRSPFMCMSPEKACAAQS